CGVGDCQNLVGQIMGTGLADVRNARNLDRVTFPVSSRIVVEFLVPSDPSDAVPTQRSALELVYLIEPVIRVLLAPFLVRCDQVAAPRPVAGAIKSVLETVHGCARGSLQPADIDDASEPVKPGVLVACVPNRLTAL